MARKHVHYFIHGRGRGHASRSLAVQRALTLANYEVQLHAGGDAIAVLGQANQRVHHRAPLKRGPGAPIALLGRALGDGMRFFQQPPDIVLSDGDQGAILGARAANVPVLSIGHDLVFDPRVRGLTPRGIALPRHHWLAQRANALPTRLADRWVAVHFLPIASSDERLTVARPEGLPQGPRVERPDGPVLCYFRDDNGSAIVEKLRAEGRPVRLFGSASPGGDRFDYRGFRDALLEASAVVTSAGSNVLAECVALNLPMLAVHRANDAEQALNAYMIEQAEVGMASTITEAPQSVERFIARVRSHDFARVDLVSMLPPLSTAVKNVLAGWARTNDSIFAPTHSAVVRQSAANVR